MNRLTRTDDALPAPQRGRDGKPDGGCACSHGGRCGYCGLDAGPGDLVPICRWCAAELPAELRRPVAPTGADAPRPRPRWLTVAEVAEALNVEPRTVRDWISSGRLRAYTVGQAATPNGRRYRVRWRDLKAFLQPTPIADDTSDD